MPAFRTGHPRTRLIMTATHAMAAGVNTLSWDAADYDDESQWNGTTDILIERAGLYLLNVQVSRVTGGSSSPVIVRIVVNGVTTLLVGQTVPANGNMKAGVLGVLELDAATVIKATVQFSATEVINMSATSTYLEAIRIGPVRYV